MKALRQGDELMRNDANRGPAENREDAHRNEYGERVARGGVDVRLEQDRLAQDRSCRRRRRRRRLDALVDWTTLVREVGARGEGRGGGHRDYHTTYQHAHDSPLRCRTYVMSRT